ncbi:helix-turn-helix domain-containing protein [Alicyclobacillus fastidiosus]|uniref:Helix-turn-helix domain-containing protein n=1 Tax=Alicyclobacillus fastidiosus TaxID=392011 RepID=A0ABY6ZCY6_9BACL|nr:helix-turn-helix domain-containing protein [Alicyclobacillus fastidiosus]WAH40648.1 helix-turn-helix domain-containing protein [Alicyclobacillus fastidiosus]
MKEFLTPEEVAEILRINVKKVYSMLQSGELIGKKWGRQWRVHRSQLEA